jgi:hypothetical protein
MLQPKEDIPIDDQGNFIHSIAEDGKQLTLDGTEAQTLGVRKAAHLQQQLTREGLDLKITYRGSYGLLLESSNPADLAAAVKRLLEALGTPPNAEALERLANQVGSGSD